MKHLKSGFGMSRGYERVLRSWSLLNQNYNTIYCLCNTNNISYSKLPFQMASRKRTKNQVEEQEQKGNKVKSGEGSEGHIKKRVKQAESFIKILSWNVNGLRAFLKKDGHKHIDGSNADIIFLQETKCKEFPDQIEALNGYPFKKLCVSTQNSGGYAGVAMLSKEKPLNVELGTGDADFDHQARFIQAEFQSFYVIGVYMMNSGRKLENLQRRHQLEDLMLLKLKDLDKKKPVIYCGDLNVAHNEIDLRNPDMNRNKTAGFTDQERNDFTRLLDSGFVDVWRRLNPETVEYTYWSYIGNRRTANIGWRLDYFVVSERIFNKVTECEIHSKITGSDHCPLSMKIGI